MFCERCGKQIDDSLNFCNGCGAQLKREGGGGSVTKSVLSGLISAQISVVVVGLGVLVALLAILFANTDRVEPIVAFALFYLATLFGISFMIMRQISRLIEAKVLPNSSAENAVPPVQIPVRSTGQLEEYRQPASVIDNTTRTLDKVHVK